MQTCDDMEGFPFILGFLRGGVQLEGLTGEP